MCLSRIGLANFPRVLRDDWRGVKARRSHGGLESSGSLHAGERHLAGNDAVSTLLCSTCKGLRGRQGRQGMITGRVLNP